MIILRNQSKHPSWLLKLLLESLVSIVDYTKPLIVRVHDNYTKQAGEAHQGVAIHTVELESPFARTETISSFAKNFLHELGHVRDYDFDPERNVLKWTRNTYRNTVPWVDRPEERRAMRFADFYWDIAKDRAGIKMLMSLFDKETYAKHTDR